MIQEHVDVVKCGATAIAVWRKAYPSERLDLTGADLASIDLHDADLRNADLFGADLTEADMSNADLRNADLSCITLCYATIDGARVHSKDIGGPGHILCALTDAEWGTVQAKRAAVE